MTGFGIVLPGDLDRRPADCTIRAVPNYRPGEHVIVYEGQCHYCGYTYGPDSISNVTERLDAHLWETHKIKLVEAREVKLGRERWDERRRSPLGAKQADER